MNRLSIQPLRRTLALAAALCALSAAVSAAGSGTISGRVTVPPKKNLEETVVYLKNAPGAGTGGTSSVSIKGMKYIPHVLSVTFGDSVKFQNDDGVDHNVFSTGNEGFNLGTFKPGERRAYAFMTTSVAYQALDSVHPEMSGWIFVAPNKFHAVVGADGSFTLSGVPAGGYELDVWNSGAKAPGQQVKVASGATVKTSFTLK